MRKRILALISASAIVALAFGAVPRAAQAATVYDFYIAPGGNTDASLAAYNTSCRNPYSHDLQDALNEIGVNPGDPDNTDTIYLCAGTYYGQFDSPDDGRGDLVLVGASPATTILDGEREGDELFGYYDGNLTVKNLTFRNGYSDYADGGAINLEYGGDFTCINSTFLDNEASNDGGAVYVGSGSATLNKCTFKNNLADYGGAIWVDDDIQDVGGVYINNSAYYHAGAVDATGSGTSTFFRSTFIGNAACYAGDGYCSGDGDGGAINTHSCAELSIISSKFVNNSAETKGGAVSVGGDCGLYASIERSTFTGNEASSGGAVYADYGLNLGLTGNIFKGNRASNLGGALYVVSNLELGAGNTFSRNTAVERPSGYKNDGAYIEYCDSFDEDDYSTPNFAHGALSNSYGYWLNDVFRNGTQTFYYTDNCSFLIP